MKNKSNIARLIAWLLSLICGLLIIVPNAYWASEAPTVTDVDVLTLSPEDVAQYYKELKGYQVHTVIYVDKYSIGDPYAHENENSEEYNFHVISLAEKEKPKKNEYIEVIATPDGRYGGFVYLSDTYVVNEGTEAKAVLNQLHQISGDTERRITDFTGRVDAIREKESEDAVKAEKAEFEQALLKAEEELNTSDSIITLTPEQLDDNHDKLAGMQFHTVFSVHSVKKNSFSAKLNSKDWFESFYCYFDWDINLKKHLNKKDIVEVIGTIKPGWLSGSEYTSCQIISVGEKAQKALDEININEKDKQEAIDRILQKTPVTETAPKSSAEAETEKKAENEKVDIAQTETRKNTETEPSKRETERQSTADVSDTEPFISIKKGDSGDSVKSVQTILIALGYLSSNADGKYGPKTAQAVSDLQKAAGLAVTGEIDKNTYALITGDKAPKKESEAETEKAILTSDNTTTMYATTTVNVRGSAGTDGALLGRLSRGDSVKAGHAVNGWTPIIYASGVGYVASQYLSSSVPLATPAPQTTPETTASTNSSSTYDPMVWIPTNGGQRYHAKSTCSGMKGPIEVPLSEAKARGFTSCGRCHPPS